MSGFSFTIIAKAELKYPNDEEKKNSICHPIIIPQSTEEFFLSFQTNISTMNATFKEFGLWGMRKNKADVLNHLSFLQKLKLSHFFLSSFDKLGKTIDMFCDQINSEKYGAGIHLYCVF